MSKKTHDHKQLRALEKQRRIDKVSHKDEPGLFHPGSKALP